MADGLTARQREVLALIVRGYSNGEIAEALGISLAGAKWHVSELLDRYDVSSRADLASSVAAQRSPRARLRRMAGALAGLAPMKAAAGAAAVVAGIGSLAAGTIIYLSTANDRADGQLAADPAPAFSLTVPASAVVPTPAPTSVPLPTAVAGAIWTPDEAYEHALAEGQRTINEAVPAPLLAAVDLRTVRLAVARWGPGITRYDLPDGDRYWDSSKLGKTGMNVWLFRWEQPDVAAGPTAPLASGTLVLDLLVEDGNNGEATANCLQLSGPGDLALGGRCGGFFSRKSDAMLEEFLRQREPVGPEVRFVSLNNDPASAYLTAYPSLAGSWCTKSYASTGELGSGGESCNLGHVLASGARLAVNRSGTVDPVTGSWHSLVLTITTAAEVAQVAIDTPAGRTLFDTAALPAAIGSTERVAFIRLDNPPATISISGLDSSGLEIAHEDTGTPTDVPPPPPGASATP